MPNAFFKLINKAFGAEQTVVGYNYDYFNIKKNIDKFNRFYQTALKHKNLVFAGTSLGGFWAHYLADLYATDKTILINPTMAPSTVLLSFKNQENYSEKRKEHIKVSLKKCRRYKSIELKKEHSGNRLIILSRDDEIQDHQIAADFFTGLSRTKLIILNNGGHHIDFIKHPETWSRLERFIEK